MIMFTTQAWVIAVIVVSMILTSFAAGFVIGMMRGFAILSSRVFRNNETPH